MTLLIALGGETTRAQSPSTSRNGTSIPGATGPSGSASVNASNLGLPNWAGQDYAARISPDGRFLIFQSDRPGARDGHNLWFTTNKNYRDRLGSPDWTVPLPLFFNPTETMRIVGSRYDMREPKGAFTVNTDGFEGMPALVYDGNEPVQMYFTSVRDSRTKLEGDDHLNIYFTEFHDQRWSPPRHLNIINSDFNDRMPFVTPDGMKMYFVSNRPGGYGGDDIWESTFSPTTKRWSVPRNLGPTINTRYNEVAPTLSTRGSMLYFSSDRPGGFGHYDLYVSRKGSTRHGSLWQLPRNLGAPFNTSRDEEYVSLTKDGLWAYFVSDRRDLKARGRFDMYRVRLPEWLRESVTVRFTGMILDGKSRLPLGVEATIKVRFEKGTLVSRSRVFQKTPVPESATNFGVDLSSGRTYKVQISAPGYEPAQLILDYRGNVPPGRLDRRVIYLQPIVRPPVKEPAKTRELRGRIIDKETGKGIPASTAEIKPDKGRTQVIRTDREGRFSFKVRENSVFIVTGSAQTYEPAQKVYRESKALREVVIPLGKRDPCKEELQACLDEIRIFFDFRRTNITASEGRKLDKIVRIMKNNPSVRIMLWGHADKVGGKAVNDRISRLRALNVRRSLIRRGIPARRLEFRGFGKSRPSCRTDTPACRRQNRRVEFRRIRPNPAR